MYTNQLSKKHFSLSFSSTFLFHYMITLFWGKFCVCQLIYLMFMHWYIKTAYTKDAWKTIFLLFSFSLSLSTSSSLMLSCSYSKLKLIQKEWEIQFILFRNWKVLWKWAKTFLSFTYMCNVIVVSETKPKMMHAPIEIGI